LPHAMKTMMLSFPNAPSSSSPLLLCAPARLSPAKNKTQQLDGAHARHEHSAGPTARARAAAETDNQARQSERVVRAVDSAPQEPTEQACSAQTQQTNEGSGEARHTPSQADSEARHAPANDPKEPAWLSMYMRNDATSPSLLSASKGLRSRSSGCSRGVQPPVG
jgi:hypothetical protein